MSLELKAYCVNCGGPMEFPAELQGEKIVCPHCQKLTTLGEPRPQAPPRIPTSVPPPVYIERPRKSRAFLLGGLMLLGLTVVVGLTVVFMVSMFNAAKEDYSKSANNSPKQTKPQIMAEISQPGDMWLNVRNNSTNTWKGVKVFINGDPPFGYEYDLVGEVRPFQSRTILLTEFTKSSGERFNPYQYKVMKAWVGGGGFDYQGYEF